MAGIVSMSDGVVNIDEIVGNIVDRVVNIAEIVGNIVDMAVNRAECVVNNLAAVRLKLW